MKITYFNRHENMTDETRKEILDLTWEVENDLANYIWGLLDGYNYFLTDDFQDALYKAKTDEEIYDRIINVYATVYLYPKFDQPV